MVAAMLSVELGLSVAVIEICLGVVVGNTLHLPTPDWLVFLAGFGSVVLTFLAGAEVDPQELRQTWKASLLIGVLLVRGPVRRGAAGLPLRLRLGLEGGRRSAGRPCPPPRSRWCTRCWWRPG